MTAFPFSLFMPIKSVGASLVYECMDIYLHFHVHLYNAVFKERYNYFIEGTIVRNMKLTIFL